jgi:hypothetical protein
MHDASLSKAGGDNITSHIAMSAIFSQLQGETGGFEFFHSSSAFTVSHTQACRILIIVPLWAGGFL